MANRQTTPGIQPVRQGLVDSQPQQLMPQISWQSPLRDDAGAMEQAADFTKTYQNLRFEEYQAKYDNLANQMYHEMGDATDPCQLGEIKKKYDEQFAKTLDDTIWASSYNNSRYKKDWMREMNINYEKVYLKKMHEFSAIQAERTLNEMSSAAVQTDDVLGAASYFDSGMNLIGNMQHLTPEEKNRFQMAYARDFIGKLYTKNPNFALSFAENGQDSLAKYGIDINDIRNKAQNYNEQKKNDEWQAYTRAKQLKSDNDGAMAKYFEAQIISHPEMSAELQKQALEYSNEVGVAVSEFVRKRSSANSTPTVLQSGMAEAAKRGRQSYEKYVKDNFAEISLDSKARASRDDLDKFFGIDRSGEKEDLASGYEVQIETKKATGKKININTEISKIDALDIKDKEKAELIKIAGKAYNEQVDDETKERDAKEKGDSLNSLNNARIALSNADTVQKLSFIFDTYSPSLTEEDRGKLITAINQQAATLKSESKISDNEQRKLNQDILYFRMKNDGKFYTPNDFANLLSSGQLTLEQVKDLQSAQETKMSEALDKENKSRRKDIFLRAYSNSERGIITDYSGYEDVLSVDDMSKIKAINLNTQKNKYNTELSRLALQHMGNVVPEEMQQSDLIYLKGIAPLDANVEEDYQKKIAELGNAEEGILSNTKAMVDMYFVPAGEKLTDYEIQQKARAVSEILSKSKDKTLSNLEIMGIIQKYKPNAEQLRQYGINQSSAEYLLENQKNNIFQIGETKIEDGDSVFKTPAILLNEDATFNDMRNYQLTVEDAYAKGFIDEEEYGEFMKPMMAGYEPMVNKVLSSPDSVIGEIAVKLRDFLYPSSEDLDLFEPEITDYQDFYNQLNEIANILESYGIPLDKSKSFGYKVANFARAAMGNSIKLDGTFLSAAAVFDEYISVKYKNNAGGTVIK